MVNLKNEFSYSYIISSGSDGNYYVQNGTTGKVGYSGSNALTSIQWAINLCENSGSTIFIKYCKGGYPINGSITMKSCVNIILENGTLLKEIGNVASHHGVVDFIGDYLIFLASSSFIALGTGIVQGITTNLNEPAGIFCQYVKNIKIKDIEIKDHGASGLRLSHTYTSLFENLYIHNFAACGVDSGYNSGLVLCSGVQDNRFINLHIDGEYVTECRSCIIASPTVYNSSYMSDDIVRNEFIGGLYERPNTSHVIYLGDNFAGIDRVYGTTFVGVTCKGSKIVNGIEKYGFKVNPSCYNRFQGVIENCAAGVELNSQGGGTSKGNIIDVTVRSGSHHGIVIGAQDTNCLTEYNRVNIIAENFVTGAAGTTVASGVCFYPASQGGATNCHIRYNQISAIVKDCTYGIVFVNGDIANNNDAKYNDIYCEITGSIVSDICFGPSTWAASGLAFKNNRFRGHWSTVTGYAGIPTGSVFNGMAEHNGSPLASDWQTGDLIWDVLGSKMYVKDYGGTMRQIA